MTGYTVHTGTSEKFAEGWDTVFGGGKRTTRKKSTKKKASKKKGAKAGKKKSAKKVVKKRK